jgi:hypothetical protein
MLFLHCWLLPLMYRGLLVWCNPICPFFSFVAWDFGVIYVFCFIVFTFTHMHIHYLSHLPPSTTCRQNLFCFLVLWFFWRENIRDNKKRIASLLLWDKHSYSEIFLALLPCTCVLQSTLVHLYQTSSLLPGPLPIAASPSLRLLYSRLCSEHINRILVLGFFPFPISPVHALLLVCDPCPIILLQLF